MLNTIDLDDEHLRYTREVYDIAFNRMLAPEVIALSAQRPQLFPKPFFSDSFVFAKVASDLVGHDLGLNSQRSRLHPTPNPSP